MVAVPVEEVERLEATRAFLESQALQKDILRSVGEYREGDSPLGTRLGTDVRSVHPREAREIALAVGASPPREQSTYTQIPHTQYMGTRTISLAEDAYEALSAMRRPGESFTDVVRRLTRTRSLTELGEAMDSEAADDVASAVEANREKRIQRRREELDLE